MSTRTRSRAYRLEQKKKHRTQKPAGPKPKKPTYEQNKRNQERVQLRNYQDWSC